MNKKQQDLTREFERVAPLPDVYRGWRDQLKFYRKLAERMPDQRRSIETPEGFEQGPRAIIDHAIRDAENAAEAGDLDDFALRLQAAVEVLIHSDFGTVGELFEKKWQSRAGSGNAGKTKTPELWKRGFMAVLDEFSDITPSALRDILDGMPRTYDDQDIEISLESDGSIKVLDLITEDEQRVSESNQRAYLARARNS